MSGVRTTAVRLARPENLHLSMENIMKSIELFATAVIAAVLSLGVHAGTDPAAAEPAAAEPAAAGAPGPAPAMPPAMVQKMEQMQEMRRQQMERMRASGQMPMMGPRGAMMDPEMQQQMMEMRQQRMQMMSPGGGGMPMMGPHGAMMDPEMRQQIQEMRQQHRQMMQQAQVEEPVAAEAEAAADDAPPAPQAAAPAEPPFGMGPCRKMHAAMGGKCGGGKCGGGKCGGGMGAGRGKQQMMQMRKEHMQTMEQRLANIEALLREMVEMQKAR